MNRLNIKNAQYYALPRAYLSHLSDPSSDGVVLEWAPAALAARACGGRGEGR